MEKKKSVAQRILLKIQDDIIFGRIKQGEIITERGLEQQYGVSRTPIKEALKQLNLEGWVEISPRHETKVSHFGVEELKDAKPIRISLESIAIRFCIQRMTPSISDNFRDLLSDFVSLENGSNINIEELLTKYNNLDNRFHTLIYQNSESKMLQDFNARLRSMLKRTYNLIPLDEARIYAGISEIIQILRAILEGDDIAAEIGITKHIINSIDQKIKVLETKQTIGF